MARRALRGIKQRHPLGSVATRAGVAQLSVVSSSSVSTSTGVKISALPPASAGTTTDQFEVNQGGVSKRLTLEQIRDLVSPEISVGDFGAVGDGVTDDTAALQAAIDAAHAAGGGVVDCSGGRYLVDSADLNLKYGVTLSGFWKNFVKKVGLDYSTVQSCIVINPLYTIRVLEQMSSIVGLVILRKGQQRALDIREALDELQAYDGVAVTVGDGTIGDPGSDFYIGYTTIGGFNKALYIDGCSRPHIEWVNFDCTNGLDIRQCFDMDHIVHCHGWGFLQAHSAWGGTYWSIANVTNNGSGLIRITTTAPHQLVTGDNQILVSEVVGVPNANNAFTVTAINSTTVDLQGSTFAGTYVSGGRLWAGEGRRLGTAYHFEEVDWLQAHTIFSFGWDTGIHADTCNQVALLNIGADNYYFNGNTLPVGCLIENCYMASIVQATLTSQGIGLVIDCTTQGTTTCHDVRLAANQLYQVQFKNGSAQMFGGNCDATTGINSGVVSPIRVETGFTGNAAPQFFGGNYNDVLISLGAGAPAPTFWGSIDQPNSTGNIQVTANPAQVDLHDTGSSTSKFLRNSVGAFEVVNNAYTTALLQITDAGAATFTGDLSASTYVSRNISGSPRLLFDRLSNAADSRRWHFLDFSDGNFYLQSLTDADVPTRTWTFARDGSTTLQGPLNGTSATFTGTFAGATATFTAADTAAIVGVKGTTKGVRIGTDAAGGHIDGVDSTLAGSFQPLLIGGSVIALQAPLTGTSTATFLNGTAVGAGANTQAFVKASSTADLGIYYGTGAPTFNAAKGSLYTNTTATTTTTRLYVNTSGTNTWTNLTTAA